MFSRMSLYDVPDFFVTDAAFFSAVFSVFDLFAVVVLAVVFVTPVLFAMALSVFALSVVFCADCLASASIASSFAPVVFLFKRL